MVYGLFEVTFPVLCMVLLLLLLLMTVRCGGTVLGSPYQGVGSAASCPQVTRLMCSVHQSLAPLANLITFLPFCTRGSVSSFFPTKYCHKNYSLISEWQMSSKVHC